MAGPAGGQQSGGWRGEPGYDPPGPPQEPGQPHGPPHPGQPQYQGQYVRPLQPPRPPPLTAKERIWGPILGASLTVVFVLGAMFLTGLSFGLVFVMLYDGRPVLALVTAAVGAALVCAIAALAGLALRLLGEPLWFLVALLVTAPGGFSGFFVVFFLSSSSGPSSAFLVLAVLSATWFWAFAVIRWRLARTPLLPWRLPAAAVAYPLLVTLLVVGANAADALGTQSSASGADLPELVQLADHRHG